MTIARHPDWPERLADFLHERLAIPFAWGTNDCCLFAADAVLALTGTDLAVAWRGVYNSAAGAALTLGSDTPADFATAALGQPLDNPAFARRGDVVCVSLDGAEQLGIVAGNGDWCAPGPDGLVYRPMSEVSMVWRV